METPTHAAGEPLVLLGAVLPVVQALVDLGASASAIAGLIGEHGVAPDQEARLPLSSLVGLESGAAQLTGRADAGLAVGAICAGEGDSRGGLIGQAARHCDTFGEALRTAIRLANSLGTGETLALDASGICAAFSFERSNPLHRTVFAAEVAMAQFALLLRRMTAEPPAIRAEFAHAAPAYAERYADSFGRKVRFGQPANRILFPRDMLDRRLRFADPYISAVLTQRAEMLAQETVSSATAAQLVERHILASLPDALPDAATIAAAMHMSESTLYRQLRKEGTSFRRLLDTLRRDLAARHGSQALSRDQLAHLLGYSSVRSLGHAKRRWKQ